MLHDPDAPTDTPTLAQCVAYPALAQSTVLARVLSHLRAVSLLDGATGIDIGIIFICFYNRGIWSCCFLTCLFVCLYVCVLLQSALPQIIELGTLRGHAVTRHAAVTVMSFREGVALLRACLQPTARPELAANHARC